MKLVDGVPRRNRIDLQTPAEAAVRAAVAEVEALPPNIRLTKAVLLLDEARNKIADYVDSLDDAQGLKG